MHKVRTLAIASAVKRLFVGGRGLSHYLNYSTSVPGLQDFFYCHFAQKITAVFVHFYNEQPFVYSAVFLVKIHILQSFFAVGGGHKTTAKAYRLSNPLR